MTGYSFFLQEGEELRRTVLLEEHKTIKWHVEMADDRFSIIQRFLQEYEIETGDMQAALKIISQRQRIIKVMTLFWLENCHNRINARNAF